MGLHVMDRYPGWVLFAIILLAAALRVYHIDQLSLWGDEALSATIARNPVRDIALEVRRMEQIPPLYHYFLHYWSARFGQSDFSLRVPSLLFGLGSIWIIFKLGKELYGPREGLLAALLIAVSRYQVDYGREARPYTLMLFMSLLATLAFVRVVREGKWWQQVAYMVCAGVMLWTHIYTVFVFMAHHVTFAFLWWRRRQGRDTLAITTERWINLFFGVLVIFSPWIPTVLLWAKRVTAHFWIPKMGALYLPWMYAIVAGSAALLVILVVLAVWGIRRTREPWKIVLLVSLFLLPVALPYVVSLLKRPLLVPRYGMAVVIGLYLLAARGLVNLRGRFTLAIVLAVMAGVTVAFKPGYQPGVLPKVDARGACRYVAERVKPYDAIVINAGYGAMLYQHYLRDVEEEGRQRIVKDVYGIPTASNIDGEWLWMITQHKGLPGSPTLYSEKDVIEAGWELVENVDIDAMIHVKKFRKAPGHGDSRNSPES